MSEIKIDKKTVYELFSEKRADFLIPDYQRPYAWEETECQTLWDDLKDFAIPNNNIEDFDDDIEEYLNSAVFFLVRKFYMLRCLLGALYFDMRRFGVFWVFSKHKIPRPNQWGSMKNHKK